MDNWDIDLNDFDKIQKYIDNNNILFTEWIKNESIHSKFIFNWLDRWSYIPNLAYISISCRKDSYLFYSNKKISNDSREFIRFLQYQLSSKYFEKHFPLIQEKIRIFKCKNKFKKLIYKINPLNTLIFVNVFKLLEYLKYNKMYINLYNLFIFHSVNIYNLPIERHKALNSIVLDTHMYLLNYIEKGEFSVGNINILEGLLLAFINLKINIPHFSKFVDIFNKYFKKMNLFVKELFVKLLSSHNCIFFTELKTIHFEEVYFETHDIETKNSIYIILFKKVELNHDLEIHPHILYSFLSELNSVLDYYKINLQILSLNISKNIEFDDYLLVLLWKYMDMLINYLSIKKSYTNCCLDNSGIRKYLCHLTINHLYNFYTNKYSYLDKYTLEFIIQSFLNVYKFYGNKEEFLEEIIIKEMSKDHYNFFIQFIENEKELHNYTNVNRIEQDYPLELLDIITMEPLIEPMELPDNKNIVNKSTIELHLYNSSTDPFTRKKITIEAVETYNNQVDVLERMNKVKAKIDNLTRFIINT